MSRDRSVTEFNQLDTKHIIAIIDTGLAMEWMSERVCSAHSRLSGGTFQKACKAGRRAFYIDGSTNAEASDARQDEMTNLNYQRRSTGGGNP